MKTKNNRVIRMAGIKAGPGERSRGWIKAGERADHTPFHIPVCIVNGAKPGPVVYMQAASDGDELNGVAVIHKILKLLDESRMSGAVIAVPLVNIHAFTAHVSSSPVDGRKMNRCFPGRRDGTSSERIAYFLFHRAVLLSDICIDLHQGGVDPMIDECRVRVNKNERAGRQSLELARVFGIGYIFHQKGPRGQLARAAPAMGIPTIDPELGGCRGWNGTSIRKGVRGVLNVLKHYGLIEGKPVIPRAQAVVRTLKPVYADSGGFLLFRRRLYDSVGKGEKIADILDPFGERTGGVISPDEGILWSHTPYPAAAEGECVASVGARPGYI